MEADRRRFPRMRTLWAGVVAFDKRRAQLPCTVRNASENGALLKVSEAITLPTDFELDIPSRQRRYAAHMVWRHGEAIGVCFDHDVADEQSELMKRLKATETANAQLQERVRQLTEG